MPHHETKVAVVIPCYNHVDLLRRALASVAQQVGLNPEIIVVDDGSRDGGSVARVVHEFDGAHYIRQENAGPSAARNRGLSAANAPYITFLDADDVLLPNALKAGVDALVGAPHAAFAVGDYIDVWSDGRREHRASPALAGSMQYAAILQANIVHMLATAMFRRDALQSAGGFPVELRGCEDWALYVALLRNQEFVAHHELVAEYHHHDLNSSHDPVRMFVGGVELLRREASLHALGSPLRLAANAGLAHVRGWYGYAMLQSARTRVSRFGRICGCLKVGFLFLRHDPGMIGWLAGERLRYVRRVYARRSPTSGSVPG